jgi:Domain of unknown function (DUF2760)
MANRVALYGHAGARVHACEAGYATRKPAAASEFAQSRLSFGGARPHVTINRVEYQMGGVWTRLKLAVAAFFTILFKHRLPTALQSTTTTAPPPAPAAVPSPAPLVTDDADRAVQMLALLQRDGRLVDFLMEDLGTYADAQIGGAVRDVHAGCRRALERYVTLEPIVAGREGETTTAADPIDPAAIRLMGNVTGRPPFRGTLLHRGWRASRLDLPPLGAPPSRRVVAQAEIEIA